MAAIIGALSEGTKGATQVSTYTGDHRLDDISC